MYHQVHRVKRDPPVRIIRLPVDSWRGGTYVEADGIELEVQCSGKMPTKDWPQGTQSSMGLRTVGHPLVKVG